MAEKIDVKYLKGLKYNGATAKEVKDKETGKAKTSYTPFERALEPGDVTGWADKGDTIVITTKDGKKHEVAKGKGKE